MLVAIRKLSIVFATVLLAGLIASRERPALASTVQPWNRPTFLPLISAYPYYRYAPGIYGYVTEYGKPVQGVELLLCRDDDDQCLNPIGIDDTNADGLYSFTAVPSLPAGRKYFVLYQNEMDLYRLRSWHTRDLTRYTAGSRVNIGNFDIAYVQLIFPSDRASVTLPEPFRWKTRENLFSDKYGFVLIDQEDSDRYYETGPLGYRDEYTLDSLPAGLNYGAQYYWTVKVYSTDHGYGNSQLYEVLISGYED